MEEERKSGGGEELEHPPHGWCQGSDYHKLCMEHVASHVFFLTCTVIFFFFKPGKLHIAV